MEETSSAVTDLRSKVDRIENLLERSEQERRKTNIIITGLPLRQNVPHATTPQLAAQETVKAFFKEHLKLDSPPVCPLNVLTIRSPDRPLRFLVTLPTHHEKLTILRSCKLLKHTPGISVSEDLTPRQQARRSQQLPEFRKRRAAGHIVFFRSDRLFMKRSPDAAPELIPFKG